MQCNNIIFLGIESNGTNDNHNVPFNLFKISDGLLNKVKTIYIILRKHRIYPISMQRKTGKYYELNGRLCNT